MHSVSILKSLLDAQSPTSELLSPRRSNWSEGRWLQLMCCALSKRLCPLFQTRRLMSEVLSVWRSEGRRVGGSEVWRFGGSEVLSSRWFDIQTSKCYREFELFNRRLALMYNDGAEARTREWEYWNSLIYWKRKGENWDEDMKMNSEFKRTKTEWWR